MKRLEIEILGIAETHWINETSEALDYNDYVIMHHSRNDDIPRQGVFIVSTKEMSNHMIPSYQLTNNDDTD